MKSSLDEMYVVAFLDPDTWGDTGEIEDFFTGEAVDQLEGDAAALTLGIHAGDTYEYVSEPVGELEVRVLTGKDGSRIGPSRRHVPRARGAHGRDLHHGHQHRDVLLREGRRRVADQSYRVDRNEKAAEAPPPTAAASASGDAG